MGETFADIAASGPLLLGVAVAAIAGLVSFLSPCVLPLVPGYLAYVTGLSGAELGTIRPPGTPAGGTSGGGAVTDAAGAAAGAGNRPAGGGGGGAAAGGAGTVAAAGRAQVRGRVLAGGLLFVAGFGAVFVTAGVLAAAAGRTLAQHQRLLEAGGGILMIVFALALVGLVPGLQREVRVRWLPAAGLAGAPVFGAVFALSWIPCVGPTLAAVLALGALGGDTGRAAVLTAAYTAGIGAPLLAFGLGFRWLVGALALVRRHGAWVTRVGAVLLVLVGLALLTGAWGEFLLWLRGEVGIGDVSI
jgi:cytochrome c-type biogenesis protein